MSHSIGLIIESMVAVLLMVTIGYCFQLNKQLRRLKSDEASMKTTIRELIAATDTAERAVGGLKETVHDCDKDLGERLKAAERLSADMARQLALGEDLINKLTGAGAAPRQGRDPAPPDAKAMLAAAQAFAARAGARAHGSAAA